MKAAFIVFVCGIALPAITQTVSTLPVKGLNGPNGFAMDKGGHLLIANEPGKKVVKLVNDSTAEEVLSSDSPSGLDFDNEGNLYISNFFSGMILRKRGNAIDTFARGLNEPSDIKYDGAGYFYIAEYKTGMIKRINPRGEITVFAKGFNLPFGLAFDEMKNLYVANNTTGIINKVGPSGDIDSFARLPGSISYLTYSKKTGNLYAACFTCHAVYSITGTGKVSVVAGNGNAGNKDGKGSEAQFNGPNSIIISPRGILYVSEFPVNRIRKITGLEN